MDNENVELSSKLTHALSLPHSYETESKDDSSLLRESRVRQKSTNEPQSAPPSIKDRSWSFGGVAKAVGCGVTAFSSGVVHGTKVMGSGVVHGTKVMGSGVVHGTKVMGSGVVHGTMVVGSGVAHVGSGVVQGTKMAGRVTKDVTLGVLNAGEMVGSGMVSSVSAVGNATVIAGLAVGNASVNAVSESTKWVRDNLDLEDESQTHTVLPGETLNDISSKYSVSITSLICLNALESRELRAGNKIQYNRVNENEEVLEHPLDKILIICHKRKEIITLLTDFASHHFDVESSISLLTTNIRCLNIEEENTLPPNLLTHKSLDIESIGRQEEEEKEVKRNLHFEVFNFDVMSRSVEKTFPSHHPYFKLQISFEDKLEKTYIISQEDVFNVFRFAQLWIPEKLKFSPIVTRSIDASQFSFDFGAQLEYLTLPPNRDPSSFLSQSLIENLQSNLPGTLQNLPWILEYSTDNDGFSLANLFRRFSSSSCQSDNYILLTLQDDNNIVFGALLSCAPVLTDSFIGTGESWLFSDMNGFHVYRWSGLNHYFYKGEASSIMIGGGEGKFGLILDSDLNKGRSQPCLTFHNEPLTANTDFSVKCLEAWSFS